MAPRLARAALAAVLAALLAAWPGGAVGDPAQAATGPAARVAGAAKDDPTPPPTPDPADGPHQPGHVEQEPSAAEILAEQRRAAALLAAVDERADELAQAQERLDRLARAAALALERYTSALTAEREARFEADRQDDLLLQAQLRLAAQRAVLGRWAREAYGEGDLAVNPALGTILGGGSTNDLGRALTYLERVGASKSRAVTEYADALRAQTDAARAAEDARTAAETARDAARTARAAADAAVEQQRTEVADREARLADAQDAAAAADLRAKNLARALAVAARLSGLAGSNRVTGPVGECRGGDTSQYGNGMIPPSALCPLWGTAGHRLRADAAYAFDRLSRAYAQQFGEPICVTDSYRDYAAQVDLYARKPELAAVPGTSNHGWGAATDLCGGIESFDAETHRWMTANAPAYGWFHPSWAQASGSRPEPWHWEFAG